LTQVALVLATSL